MAANKAFEWTDDIEEMVLDAHSSGRTLLDVCGPNAPTDAKGMQLTYQMVCTHERTNTGFREKMALAIDQYCRVMFDECLRIAKDSSGDWRQRLTKGGDTVAELNLESIARSKLQIDTIMKMLPKIRPEKYGDHKKSIEVTGKGGGPIETKDVSTLDLARRMALILQQGKQAKLAGTNAGTPQKIEQKVTLHPVAAAIVAQVAIEDDDTL